MAKYTEYETKSGTKWRVRGYLGVNEATGKQIEFDKRNFKTKKKAQAAYTRAKNDFNNGDFQRELYQRFTFNQVYQEWYELYKLDVKESTANKTQNHFEKHILPNFGNLMISKITVKVLQTAVNEWHKKFVTYKKLFNYTKNVFEFAFKRNYIKHDPCSLVFVPKKTNIEIEKKTKDFYSRSELEALLNILERESSVKWYTVFRLLSFTGIRRGELLALTWGDINIKEGLLSVNKTLTTGLNNKLIVSPPKTKAGYRTITLDNKTVETLKNWKAEQGRLLIGFGFNAMNPKQLVFSQLKSNTHLYLSAPRNKLSRLCRLNDFEMINIHGFRHTHCSLLFEAGVGMKDVKERLGHEDIQTTMNIYTHVTQDSKNKSAELFAQYANF